MQSIDTVVIGAGQAGLAASRCLRELGVDHVVLERGRIADRWRTERWDSLRLLTPNWMSRLPGWRYTGVDPDGFMTAAQITGYLQGYAESSGAPVLEEHAVLALHATLDGFEVATTCGVWRARSVVLATGWCDQPAVPEIAQRLDHDIVQIAPSAYRSPRSLADGGVLVVGASASGVQIADELAAAGRDVVVAVGRHTRLPRDHRGMDIFWWLGRIGSLDRTIDDAPDPVAAHHEPSLQLVGRPDRRNLDLAALQARGVELTGRLTSIDARRVGFADDLAATAAAADSRMRRVLSEIDAHIETTGLTAEVLDSEPPAEVAVGETASEIDLGARGITTVVWATGYRRSYPWLHVPVLDERGEIRHHRGITPMHGLYVLGQRFQHNRRSSFIDGVGADAAFVVQHLATRRGAAART